MAIPETKPYPPDSERFSHSRQKYNAIFSGAEFMSFLQNVLLYTVTFFDDKFNFLLTVRLKSLNTTHSSGFFYTRPSKWLSFDYVLEALSTKH